MRLAYFSHYFPPESNAPAARVHELSRALVELGHEVHVVTGQPSHPHGRIYPGYRAAEYRLDRVDGISVHRCPTLPAANRGVLVRSLGFLAMPPTQLALALARVPAVDVVLATSPQILTGVAGLAFARARRIPFLFEVRDLWPDSIVGVGALPSGHPIIRALRLVERGLYASAAGIVSVTDSFVDHFEGFGVPRDRIVVVKNGIDTALFDPDIAPAPLREELGIPASALLVLYCGNIGLAQDTGIFARAMARRPANLDVHVVLVGDGAERKQVEEEIVRLGVGDRVHLRPSVPRKQVPALLAAADVSAVVLRDDPLFAGFLPSKLFESMAMRRPIVLGVRGEARALVERAGAGLYFEPGDPDALLAALKLMADLGPSGRAALGDAARVYALTHHDRRRQAEALAQFAARFVT